MRKLSILLILMLVVVTAGAQMRRSTKRGVCEESNKNNTIFYSDQWVDSLRAGISWTYNWTPTPGSGAKHIGTPVMAFAPMCWNGHYDREKLIAYLDTHPDTKVLLGFNEPNFAEQGNMTPLEAAQQWPELEEIAVKYDLLLVSPALNFSNSEVGGRVWGIADWLGEFIHQYRLLYGHDPRMDYISLHCYMNWADALDWYVNRYLYEDACQNAHLRDYFERQGRKQIVLSEWCAWEGDKDGFKTDEETQIDQMVRKVQILEKSDNVAAYAWFMAKGENNYGFPYYRIFENNQADSPLTELGRVYTYMSSFDADCWFDAGQHIPAVEYIDMNGVRVRQSSDPAGSEQIELRRFNAFVDGTSNMITPYVDYQLNVPSAGLYTFTMRVKACGDMLFSLDVDGRQSGQAFLTSTDGRWADRYFTAYMPLGHHTIRVQQNTTSDTSLSWMKFERNAEGQENYQVRNDKR